VFFQVPGATEGGTFCSREKGEREGWGGKVRIDGGEDGAQIKGVRCLSLLGDAVTVTVHGRKERGVGGERGWGVTAGGRDVGKRGAAGTMDGGRFGWGDQSEPGLRKVFTNPGGKRSEKPKRCREHGRGLASWGRGGGTRGCRAISEEGGQKK